MTTYVLEMRSTADWQDVRYREYTTSAKKAELFKTVPKIRFTDSGHGIVPSVHEHRGRKLPRNMILQDHVLDHIVSQSRAPKPKRASVPAEVVDEMLSALLNVRAIIAEAAMTGFNCHDGDWAEKLFLSQQKTSAAIKKASASSSPERA